MTKRAYIFDLEGVILHIDYSKTFKKFSEYGIELKYDSDFRTLIEDYDKGAIDTQVAYKKFCHRYCRDKELSFDQFVVAWNAMLLYIPDASLEYLFNLKKRGVVLVLLSNINALHLEKVKEAYGDLFDKLFDKMFFSCNTGVLKPEPKSFQLAIGYLITRSISKSEIEFVDDSSANLKACAKEGVDATGYPINGIWKDKRKYVSIRSIIEKNYFAFFEHYRIVPCTPENAEAKTVVGASVIEYEPSKAIFASALP